MIGTSGIIGQVWPTTNSWEQDKNEEEEEK